MASAGIPAVPMTSSSITYQWPLIGPVIRGFDPPSDPYGSGHRGIDIAAPFGSPVRAAGSGVVAFAGKIGAGLYVSIDHADGVRTTYSWLSTVAVRRGQHVLIGSIIGLSGQGHPGAAQPHLHLGVRQNGEYIDPLSLLPQPDLSDSLRLIPDNCACGSGRVPDG